MKKNTSSQLPARTPDPEQVKRILIIKPSSLGDVFHVFPAAARLGKLFPHAVFDWLIHPSFAEALDYAPVPVARKIFFRRKELAKVRSFLPEFLSLCQELRQDRYDYIFDFQGLMRSAIFARCAHGPVIGFARPREGAARLLYSHWIKVNLRLHAVRRNQLLVERCFQTGTMAVPSTLPAIGRYRDSLNGKLACFGLSADSPLVGVSPGARWPSKVFPAQIFANAIRQAAEMLPDAHFILMGAPVDQKIAEQIMELADCDRLHSLAGATGLGELVELIRSCRVLLSNDSGPVHIAAAAEVPVVCFYGPTNPGLTGPFGDIHTILQRSDLACIKCLSRECPHPFTECHNIDAALAAAAIRAKYNKEHKICSEN